MMKEIILTKSFITLGQLLKLVNLISSGGLAKYYLSNNSVYVNGKRELRRGRKLYPEDQIKFSNSLIYVMKAGN